MLFKLHFIYLLLLFHLNDFLLFHILCMLARGRMENIFCVINFLKSVSRVKLFLPNSLSQFLVFHLPRFFCAFLLPHFA